MLLATSVYFNSLPILREEISRRMAGKGAVTFESQLALRGQIHQEVLAFFKQNRSVYKVVHFQHLEKVCPICNATVAGEHVEFVNSATGKWAMVPSLVYHAVVAHNQAGLEEQDLDLGGNVRAVREMSLNAADLVAALKDGTASPEVLAELNGLAAAPAGKAG